jgi:BTB/POZ domain
MEDGTKQNEEIPPSIFKEISHHEMLARFLTADYLNDVKLKGTDGVEVPANRFLLAARSHIFQAMFFGEFQEAKCPTVELGFQGNVLRAVVEYIVTDSTEMINTKKKRMSSGETKPDFNFKSIESLVSLAEAASYFQLPELGKKILALLEDMMLQRPSFSLALFNACTMAGLPVVEKLTDTAMECVRSLTFETIAADQISCLSAHVLETILKDGRMVMTEYDRFQILQEWVDASGDSPSTQIDRHATAANLSKYISLENIDPIHLSTTVTASGLVTFEKLSEVYKNQALALASQATSQGMFKANRISWTHSLPPNKEPPEKIKVVGAGTGAVNGTYQKDNKRRYSMQGMYEGEPCVFSISRVRSARHIFLWYISLRNLRNPGTEDDTDFYWCYGSDWLPPCNGWQHCNDAAAENPLPDLLYWDSNNVKCVYDETNA